MFCRSLGRIKVVCRNKQILKNLMIMICFFLFLRFFKLHSIIQFAFGFKLSYLTDWKCVITFMGSLNKAKQSSALWLRV